MKKPPRHKPAELTSSWPTVASSDAAGEAARRFVLNLRAAMGDRSIRGIAVSADLDEATVRHVLAGTVWPDLLTIARLEAALGKPLYPS